MNVSFVELFGDNPAALEIAREQRDFWEFRLTAALLRAKLQPSLRRWRDLRDGLYKQRLTRLSGGECMAWFQMKLSEVSDFLPPLEELYTKRMPSSWGEPSVAGNPEEIAHVCDLIGAMAAELVRWEEDVAFARFPDQIESVRKALSGAAGYQLNELAKVPDVIDYGIDKAEQASSGERTEVQHTITFSLPAGWQENLSIELAQMADMVASGQLVLD